MKKFRIFFICLFVLSAILNLVALGYVNNFTYNVNLKVKQKFQIGDSVEFRPIFEVEQEVQTTYETKKSEIAKRDYEDKVAKAEALLKKYNSPMQGLGHIIVEKADECNGDYKILLAIAGNESRFGAVPVKKYNPYGYLDGVQYESFADALSKISCYISQRFIYPCDKDISCIVRTYAGPSDDKQRWVFNINWFIKQI